MVIEFSFMRAKTKKPTSVILLETMNAPEKSDINYRNPKKWLLLLIGESPLVFCYIRKSDMTSQPGRQSTFTPLTFTRSLAFEFFFIN